MKKWRLIFVGILFFFALEGCEKNDFELQQDHEEVIMRKIGHEILLSSGDTVSLVKPIIKEGSQYRIQFATEFGFPPEELAVIIDTTLKRAQFKENYLVKVEKCATGEVVYSYEVDVFAPTPFLEELACKERGQPEACYEVIIQFIRPEQRSLNGFIYIFLIVPVFFIGLFFLKRKKSRLDKDKIKIGEYLFDAQKMTLIRQEKTIELTSKENELLSLLYASVNETVNKETLLNKVWGDEGDYVGRTLDVYISKLRKKLESDTSIKLKNIRGVGYKLIVED
ncbi:MAG: winged helix-turn-helix transcriptional regulator [Flavobacteriales bacterium]|nr:winged helix-turn-helix transcriptional regulator [Flavobacteriales bacterium]